MIEPASCSAADDRGLLQRVILVAAVSVLVVVMEAAPAWADPAGPTNYRSVVTSVQPHPTGVTVEVLGGDAFLSVAAREGHTVESKGYFGEPYFMIQADGTVLVNRLAPARWINRDRYGTSGVPDFADKDAEPEWEQVGADGVFAWHNHNIHWMSYDLPPNVVGDRAQTVWPWTIRLTIDGVETEVRGELLWIPSTNPFGPLLIGLVGILPLGRHRRRHVAASALTAAGFGAFALFVATTQYASTPPLDRAFPIDPFFPAFAIVAALGAVWTRRQPIRQWGAVLISGIALIWWAIKVGATITAPVLATTLPTAVERLGVTLALWSGLGVIALAGFELVSEVRGEPNPSESSND